MAKRQQATKTAGGTITQLKRQREIGVICAAREYVRVVDAGYYHDGLAAGISVDLAYKRLSSALLTLERLEYEHDST